MYYYAYINESNVVDNVYASEIPIVEENYVEITEEQYNLPIILYWYHPDTNTFEEWGWTCSTNDIHYPDTNIMITTILDNMSDEIDGKAVISHTHSGYAPTTHNHDSVYSAINHDHDEDYSPLSHTHNNYATATSVSDLSTVVASKADSSHNHDSRYYTETEIDSKLATKSDSSHAHTGVYDVNGAAASALSSAKSYTDTEIDTLSETVATKANASTLTAHTGNTTIHVTSTERDNWNAAKTHANSAHAPSNAEENQNAFSNVVVNGTTISADTKTDTLTFVAGSNVTITPDTNGDSITISSANTVYAHPTSAGNKHIPAGGSSGQILRWSADGTAVWGSDNNTTYGNATQTNSGLMSNTDKTKLDGIAEGANNYTLPSAGSSLGGVKTGGDVTISNGTITVNDDSHNHIVSNIDGLQTTLDGKASSSHTHTAAALVQMASALFGTGSGGGVEYSYGSGSGKNVLTEISNMTTGLHTAYAISGTTGNPRTTESFRFLIHKTSATIGWILAWDAQGSIFTNYQSAASTFKGWKCLYDASPSSMILWSGEAYMQSVNSTPQTVTPSKKLSECRTGWMLLWSDYDPGDGANDTDFCTTFIPKFTPSGGTWGGKAFYCDIPMYVGGDATDLSTEKRCIKPIYVHDDCLKGSYQNTSGGRNDVVLRAVYEV